MNRIALLCAVTVSLLAFADAKEDAQKKVDEAMAQSCQLAKDAVAKQATACADENAKLSAIDCKDKASRKTTDFLKLNGECQKKVREGAKATAEDAKKGEPKKDEKKKETTCKAVDSTGATLAEATVEGTMVKCSLELSKKVKEGCGEADAGTKKEYEAVGEVLGKEVKTKASVTCPKAKK